MKRLYRLSFFLTLFLATHLVNARNCPLITLEDLGSTTNFSDTGLVTEAISTGGDNTLNVPVQIIQFNVVCDASGERKSTSNYVSVLVEYMCSGGATAECDGMNRLTKQFQLQCSDQIMYTSTVFGTQAFAVTNDPTVTFSTTPDNRCRACVDDQQLTNRPEINDDTHCWPCAATCNEGLRRCYTPSSGPDICCNYYLEGVCVESCPSGLVPNNTTYDCECPELILDNGFATYTNNQAIGSMATLECNPGYRPKPNPIGNPLTCTVSNWTNATFECEQITCPQNLPDVVNGVVGYSSAISLVGSNAKYSCDSGYTLKGRTTIRYCQNTGQWNGTAPTCELDCGGCGSGKCNLITAKCECPQNYKGEHCSKECKLDDPNCMVCVFDASGNPICGECTGGFELGADGKCSAPGTTSQSGSSCDTGCIVGIVLAILGAIIMAVVVALVVYAVYSYLSNPATKLAKAGTEGLNGVARDNPLYLPPEDLVEGDVETA